MGDYTKIDCFYIYTPFKMTDLIDSMQEILDDVSIGEVDENTAASLLGEMVNQASHHQASEQQRQTINQAINFIGE